MTDGWQYVVPGYAFVLGGIAAYSFWLVKRGKALAEQVPEDRRRFLD